jgi:hypothetical protein
LGDFEFTDGQWREIISPFTDVIVSPAIRRWLGVIASNHKVGRATPHLVPMSRKRKRLERIAKASDNLRDALRDQAGSLLDDWELARSLSGGDFESMPDLNALMCKWQQFEQSIDSLQKAAGQKAIDYETRQSNPANVDETLNYTLECLAEVYQELVGQRPKPRVSVADEYEGIAYGPFIEFVKAFMKALPSDERVTGDQINHFLRRRNSNGERS